MVTEIVFDIGVIGDNVFEALLGLIITYNVGIHIFLWKYLKDIEKDIAENKKMAKENRGLIREIRNHYFGMEEDNTNGGSLSHFQNEFERIHEKIEESEEMREKDREKIESKIDALVLRMVQNDIIDDVENID